MQIKYRALAIMLFATALSGCGGGGGGEGSSGEEGGGEEEGGSSVPPQSKLPTCRLYELDCSVYNGYIAQGLSHQHAAERTKTLSIRMIHADAAYQRGYDGTGVTIGYYEFGIHADHPELDGVLVADDKSECQPGRCGTGLYPESRARNHATTLAAIAAGRRNGLNSAQQGMHGVAPGAQVRFVSFQNDEFVALPDDDSVGHAPAIEHLNPLVPIAFSGTSGLGISSNPTALLQLPSRAQVVDALKQAGSSASDRTIWVFPAGNSGLAIPSGTASYPIYIPELRDHVLAAVALGEDGAIWGNSNRCGGAAPHCIAAPGKAFSAYYSPTNTPTYATTYGTSNAAPTVAASLAILKQAFPSIGNDELVTRLLSTANKSGIYANQQVYGQGVVNLDAATRPVGLNQIPLGNTVRGRSASMHLSTIQTAVPTGDALAQGFAGRRLMILDALNTPFYVPFESFVSTDNPSSAVSKHTWDLIYRLVHGTSQSQASASPWLSIVGQPLAYRDEARKIESWFSAGNRDSFGFASRRPPRKKGKATISFTTGAMIEPQSHLGSTSHGAFGTMSAGTFLTGIEVERPCGAWSCQATGSLGVSLMRPAGGLIQSSTPTFASSFSLQALKVTPEYDLYVELSQPLRVESGSVEVAYPSARTPNRKILTESFEAALSPDGRQIDFQAGVILPLSKNSNLGAQAWISHNPGHARHSPPIFGAAIAYRSNF